MFIGFVMVALVLGCLVLVLWREPATGPRPADLRGRIRARGWGLLLPLGLQYASLTTQHAVIVVEVALACLVTTFAPRVATKAVPFALVILGLWGIVLVRDLERGSVPTVMYGVVPAGDALWPGRLVLPEAVLFTAAGAWLFLRVSAPGSDHLRVLFRRLAGAAGGRPSRWARLLQSWPPGCI